MMSGWGLRGCLGLIDWDLSGYGWLAGWNHGWKETLILNGLNDGVSVEIPWLRVGASVLWVVHGGSDESWELEAGKRKRE
jgi:hypothetical protein